MSRPELARRVGASPTSVANWETGRTEPRMVTGAVERELGIQLRGNPTTPGPSVAETSLQGLIAEVSRRVADLETRTATVTDLNPPIGDVMPESWAARKRSRPRPEGTT